MSSLQFTLSEELSLFPLVRLDYHYTGSLTNKTSAKISQGGSAPGNSWWGCAAPFFFKSCPDFRPKNVILHTRFQTRTLKSPTVFQTWPLRRNYVITTQIRAQTKKTYSNLFAIRIFLFFLLTCNRNDKYVHIHRSFLENHTRFQTKMSKVYTRLQTRTAQKPYPIGRHIPIWLI